MRKYLLLALLALPAGADEIDDLCRDRWGADYVMREYCIQEQRAARSRVVGSQQLDAASLMEGVRYQALMNWLRQHNITPLNSEIDAAARNNPHAARYVACEQRARNFDDGTSRFQRILDCLAEPQ